MFDDLNECRQAYRQPEIFLKDVEISKAYIEKNLYGIGITYFSKTRNWT